MIDNEKKDFYLQVRLMEFMLNCQLEGRTQMFASYTNFTSQEESIIDLVNRFREYAIPEYEDERIETLKKDVKEFFKSIHVSFFGKVKYDTDKLTKVVYGFKLYIRVGIKWNGFERFAYDAEFNQMIEMLKDK